MKTFVLFLLLQISAPGPENWTYVQCMIASSSASLSENPSQDEFRDHVWAACKAEEVPLRRLIIEQQRNRGRPQSEADADANRFFDEIRLQMLSLQSAEAR